METNNPTQETILERHTQQPVSEVHAKQKGFLSPLVMGLVIFLIAAVGGYSLYQKQIQTKSKTSQIPSASPANTQDETVNWKTYTSAELGITFNYPISWTLQEQDKEHGYFKDLKLPLELLDSNGVITAIAYVENQQNLSLQELDQKMRYINKGAGYDRTPKFFSESDEKVVTAVGSTAYFRKESGIFSPALAQEYIIPANGKVFRIISYLEKDAEGIKTIFSTFKFTQ